MSANMVDSRPARGRPRRPEGIKRLKLRESAYNMWIERKEVLRLHGISNNDFAEILLHQQLKRERDRSPHAHRDDTSPQVHQGKILARTALYFSCGCKYFYKCKPTASKVNVSHSSNNSKLKRHEYKIFSLSGFLPRDCCWRRWFLEQRLRRSRWLHGDEPCLRF